jgi:hypothetical protein
MTFVRRARKAGLRSALILGLVAGALGAPAAATATTAFTIVADIPLDGFVVQGCEEDVVLSGSLHDLFHVTENANGGATLVAVTSSAGLSGIGVTSGSRYRAVGVSLQPSHWSNIPDGDLIEQLTSTLVDRTRLVGTAGALTLDIRTTFHITKVDTETVVIFERSSVTCR